MMVMFQEAQEFLEKTKKLILGAGKGKAGPSGIKKPGGFKR